MTLRNQYAHLAENARLHIKVGNTQSAKQIISAAFRAVTTNNQRRLLTAELTRVNIEVTS